MVLERYQKVLEGGEHGAVIIPGKSAESRMILLLTGKAKPEMPPEDPNVLQAVEAELARN